MPAALVQECLEARPTSVTSEFDVLMDIGDQISSTEFLRGIKAEAERQHLKLYAVLISGPETILSVYHFFIFFDEGEVLRVHVLAMDRGKISEKSIGTIARRDYADMTKFLLNSEPFMVDPDKQEAVAREKEADLAFESFTEGQTPTAYYTSWRGAKKPQWLLYFRQRLNRMMHSLKPTYIPIRKKFARPSLDLKQAIEIAEAFVRCNGYTDLPPTSDNRQLVFEGMEVWFVRSLGDVLRMRHDTLQRKAYAFRVGQSRNKEGWTIVFRYRHPMRTYEGRAVVMNRDGSEIFLVHEDAILSAFHNISVP